ncbi:MAG: hypothetical protein ACK4NX_01905, partial [Candidatus Paceibacteria bacterium]
RWLLTPNGYSYYFFHNQDIADWHYILKSADNHFLSIHDVQRDIPIWFRPDCHALLFIPFILIGQLFSLPSFILLISIDVIGNLFCALATIFFFQTLFNDERKSLLAFCLTYFSSGIIGLIVLCRWAWLGDFSTALHGWVGENHSLGYDLMEGNMVHWSTILFRPYYLFPRAFGLLGISFLYKSYLSPKKTYFVASLLCLFFATLIHPQSGLIYGAMASILLLINLFRSNSSLLQRLLPTFYTIAGLVFAGILWKLYQRIPDVNDAVKEYLKRMYNADAVPLFFTIFPMIVPSIILVLLRTKEKKFFILLFSSMVIYGIAISEWIIREEAILLRFLLLCLVLISITLSIIWKRNYSLTLFRSNNPKVFLGICVLLIVSISLSPHHDGFKVLHRYADTFGLFSSLLKPILDALSIIYAAPFRLGIAVPLAGLITLLVADVPQRIRFSLLTGIFSISILSISLYLFILLSSNSGYLKHSDRDAMVFLKTLPGRNVLCSSESSLFIIQIAQKHTLLGGIAGVLDLFERQEDLVKMYRTSSKETLLRFLKKYQIDYIFLSDYERQLGASESNFQKFKLLYDNGSSRIYNAREYQMDSTKIGARSTLPSSQATRFSIAPN